MERAKFLGSRRCIGGIVGAADGDDAIDGAQN
jgi:hypothetical protein